MSFFLDFLEVEQFENLPPKFVSMKLEMNKLRNVLILYPIKFKHVQLQVFYFTSFYYRSSNYRL